MTVEACESLWDLKEHQLLSKFKPGCMGESSLLISLNFLHRVQNTWVKMQRKGDCEYEPHFLSYWATQRKYSAASSVPSKGKQFTNQESPLGKVWASYHFQASRSSLLSETYLILDKILGLETMAPPDSFSRCRINLYGAGTEHWALGLPPYSPLASGWLLAIGTFQRWEKNPQTCQKSCSRGQEQGLWGQVDWIWTPVLLLLAKLQFLHIDLSYMVHRKGIHWDWNIYLIIWLNMF